MIIDLPKYLMVAALLAQGVIALVLLFVLGTIRIPLVLQKKVRVRDVALSREAWPEHEKRVSNAFDNQFQLPVLFYVASGISLTFGPIGFEVVVAWLFVATRVVHAAVFATTNNVNHRFLAYTAGYLVLLVFWGELILRLCFLMIWNRI